MAKDRKPGRHPPLRLNPIEMRKRLALLKLGKFSLFPKKSVRRRPR